MSTPLSLVGFVGSGTRAVRDSGFRAGAGLNIPPPAAAISRGRSSDGFTLVEVAMAMGIIAFAFVSIFGLIPVGMTTFRRTMDLSVSSQIAQKVIGDAVETDFDVLTADSGYARDASRNVVPANYTFRSKNVNPSLTPGTDPLWRYFDDQGNELPGKAGALYHVLTRVNPEAPLPVSGSGGGVPTLAQITVQVVTNQGGKTINISDASDTANQSKPLRNLVDPAQAFSVYTYTTLIAKNK